MSEETLDEIVDTYGLEADLESVRAEAFAAGKAAAAREVADARAARAAAGSAQSLQAGAGTVTPPPPQKTLSEEALDVYNAAIRAGRPQDAAQTEFVRRKMEGRYAEGRAE